MKFIRFDESMCTDVSGTGLTSTEFCLKEVRTLLFRCISQHWQRAHRQTESVEYKSPYRLWMLSATILDHNTQVHTLCHVASWERIEEEDSQPRQERARTAHAMCEQSWNGTQGIMPRLSTASEGQNRKNKVWSLQILLRISWDALRRGGGCAAACSKIECYATYPKKAWHWILRLLHQHCESKIRHRCCRTSRTSHVTDAFNYFKVELEVELEYSEVVPEYSEVKLEYYEAEPEYSEAELEYSEVELEVE